jgi:hypothetical protein
MFFQSLTAEIIELVLRYIPLRNRSERGGPVLLGVWFQFPDSYTQNFDKCLRILRSVFDLPFVLLFFSTFNNRLTNISVSSEVSLTFLLFFCFSLRLIINCHMIGTISDVHSFIYQSKKSRFQPQFFHWMGESMIVILFTWCVLIFKKCFLL